MDLSATLSILDATIRLSTPLLLACLAGMYSERAGVFDIGLEGKMLAAAFAAGAVAAVTGSAWLGLAAGMLVSLATALLQGFAAISLKGNQLIAGVAINMLAAGLTTFLGQTWFHQGGRTPPLGDGGRFEPITLPFAEQLQGVPVLGPIYYDLLSGHYLLVYIAFIMVAVTWFVLFRTRFGLRLRAVGENPKAVDTAGISVVKLRFQAVIITGLLCGLAGAYFSIAQGSGFGNNMTAGKGFIALAALIFAKWKPVPAMFTCLLFGFLDAMQIRLQSAELFGIEVPVQAIQALPYVLTVVLLAGFIGKAVGPKAGGVPYTKER
ncbi:ABC transporter permease [Devosia sp. J2-20]|jgi:general nucleoside transport system permease protein|uniref:ABC transporter permease n=1 Tax=Devosia litorisediminis TaxID=2829817 RepID=A0A942E988_9HYPH|nr:MULTISPECIES: ABC transporter permease [Devosia]MBS3849911.1 ABC transporter permease [Devosia litorisediminis]MCZ4346911.1 ABC transporter permease [Devosia neptuniae]WDR00634.1 ABC transporter permease [Devosia sp. J2-20]|tara:strand:+ start:5638 stop:6603 length:966 start_codon:yes stop_codon:yes gene_type:complete